MLWHVRNCGLVMPRGTCEVWTAPCVWGDYLRDTASCPHCGTPHEDEAHILWDCPEWRLHGPSGSHACFAWLQSCGSWAP